MCASPRSGPWRVPAKSACRRRCRLPGASSAEQDFRNGDDAVPGRNPARDIERPVAGDGIAGAARSGSSACARPLRHPAAADVARRSAWRRRRCCRPARRAAGRETPSSWKLRPRAAAGWRQFSGRGRSARHRTGSETRQRPVDLQQLAVDRILDGDGRAFQGLLGGAPGGHLPLANQIGGAESRYRHDGRHPRDHREFKTPSIDPHRGAASHGVRADGVERLEIGVPGRDAVSEAAALEPARQTSLLPGDVGVASAGEGCINVIAARACRAGFRPGIAGDAALRIGFRLRPDLARAGSRPAG